MTDIKITPFAQSVYDATKKIPEGKVSTYKIIAHAINKPNSCRAVGAALSVNPFAPVVPCHRVIASDGSIGGFFGTKNIVSENVQNKLKLLKKEGLKFNGYVLDESTEYRKKIIFTFE